LTLTPPFHGRLLEADPTLWCVSAWNDNGALPHARDPGNLQRTGYFPGLGWMMKEGDWAPLSAQWPRAATTGWDHWIRRTTNSGGGRECIVPELPRTKHVATHGTNVQAAEQRRYAKFAFATGHPPGHASGWLPPGALLGPFGSSFSSSSLSSSSLSAAVTADPAAVAVAAAASVFGDVSYLLSVRYDAGLVALISGSPRATAPQAAQGVCACGALSPRQ